MGPGNERGPGKKLEARRAEQFPHLGNYTLTPWLRTSLKKKATYSE